MTFKKLALATAVACAVPAAFGADYIADDSMLGGVTGQDGIVIGLELGVQTDVIVHDLDGIDLGVTTWAPNFSQAGAIILQDVGIDTGGNQIVVEVDAGDDGAGAMLNVNVTIPAGTTVDTGSIRVGNSNRDNGTWGFSTSSNTILDSATLTLSGDTVANIQLGDEAQGHMIRVNTVIGNGVVLTGMALNDVGGGATLSGGAIGAGSITIVDNGGTDLSLDVGVDADEANGLVISLDTLGSGVAGIDIRVERVYLGTSTLGYIGDVEMVGLNLNGSSIYLRGK